MTVIAVSSSRTSPGATSLATGLAMALSADYERTLLIEADPAGGVMSLRFNLDVTPSLTTFGSDVRNAYSHEHMWRNTQNLRGVACLPGPVDPRLARSWVERVTPTLVEHLPTIGAPVVVDLGWVSEDGVSLPLVEAADVTLVVTRPEIAEVQALLFQVRQMQAAGATVGLVTVGSEPNDPQEVAAVAGVPLVAVLPDDAKVAAALRGAKFEPKKFRRSLLWRTIGGMAASLVNPELIAQRTQTEALFSSAAADEPVVDLAGTTPTPGGESPAGEPISVESLAAVPAPTAYGALTPEALETRTFEADSSRPTFAERHVGALTSPGFGDEDPFATDPDAGQAIAAELAEYGLFDDTRRMPPHRLVAELTFSTGERCHIDPMQPVILGRHSDCDVVIADRQASRRHGRLTHTDAGWHYVDLDSRNGSVINGRPCAEGYLGPGDELFIGQMCLTFQTVSTREMESA